MAWWDDWDDWMKDLFADVGAGSLASSQGAVAASKGAVNVASTLAKSNDEYIKKANVNQQSAPAAPAVPKPSPAATPAKAAFGEQDLAARADAMRAKYDAQNSSGKSKYAFDDNSPVYFGKGKLTGHPSSRSRGDYIVPMGQAVNDIYGWDDRKTLEFSKLAEKAGYNITPTINKSALMKIWSDMVNIAAGSYSAGKKVDPWTLIRRYATGSSGLNGAPTSKTTTNKTYSVTDALTAEQLAHAALSERLGRSASDTEVADFKAALAAAEKKTPTVTTTTTDAAGNTTSTTKEGMNSANALNSFTTDWAGGHNEAEAKAYQTAGQMMPWFFEALSAPV